MIFIDASALIAVLAQEAEAPSLISCLCRDDARLYSAVVPLGSNCRPLPLAQTYSHVGSRQRRFYAEAIFLQHCADCGKGGILAFEAMQRFGKGRHPAALYMGDCFAYACAKSAGAKLLYKGNDFALTDLA